MAIAVLPRYPLPGYADLDPEQAAEMMHRRKNKPEVPYDMDALIMSGVVKPYELLTAEEKAFPTAMYREWQPDQLQLARMRAAGRLMMNISNPLELEQIDQFIGAFDSINAINADDQRRKRNEGWSDSQKDAEERAFFSHRALATDAAISNTTDRRTMSEKALAHRDAVEDAADDHITEIPRTPIPTHQKRKRGRPAKVKVG